MVPKIDVRKACQSPSSASTDLLPQQRRDQLVDPWELLEVAEDVLGELDGIA
jgi:hypothetical protein